MELSEKQEKTNREIIEKLDKKVKFALILKNGEEARNLKEIKKYFDLDEMMECFIDETKLLQWLNDRGYDDKAAEVDKLKKKYDAYREEKKTNHNVGDNVPKDIARRICELFKGEVDEDAVNRMKIDEIAALAEKDDEVKVLTDHSGALNNIKNTIRDNDEFHKLVKKLGRNTYYLLANDEPYAIEADRLYFTNRFEGVERKNTSDSKVIVEITATKARILDLRKHFNKIFSNVTLKFKDKEGKGSFSGEDTEVVPLNNNRLKTQNFDNLREKDDSYTWVEGQITRYVDAGFPLLYINTFEEDKVDEIVTLVTDGRYNTMEWSVLGLNKKDKTGEYEFQYDNMSFGEALNLLIKDFKSRNDVKGAPGCILYKTIFVIKDAKEPLQNASVIAKLKYLAQVIYQGYLEDSNIIVIADDLKIPRELEKYLTIIPLGYLGANEIKKNILDFCKFQGITEPTGDFLNGLAAALSGLSEFDIVNNLRLVLSGDNELKASDIKLINEQKKQAIKKTNILEMINVTEKRENIGGLQNLMDWLERKGEIFRHLNEAKSRGVSTPKGVLIAGMPGCGKSLSAKATATMLNLPLLRMDMGRIMGKYVGESEANMRRAFALSEGISPCILWIDEMEKAFAGITDGNASEVTMRLLGSFLTWMQEKTAPVFVVATANDITKMPPELLRKGRFDEIFYVGLPNHKEREHIFKIHIAKRYANALKDFDVEKDKILRLTRGVSGADIEGVVREAAELTFIDEIKIQNSDKEEGEEKTVEENNENVAKEINPFIVHLESSIEGTPSLLKSSAAFIGQLSKFYKNNQYKNASRFEEDDEDRLRMRFKYFMSIQMTGLKKWFNKKFSGKNKDKNEGGII